MKGDRDKDGAGMGTAVKAIKRTQDVNGDRSRDGSEGGSGDGNGDGSGDRNGDRSGGNDWGKDGNGNKSKSSGIRYIRK